MKKYTETHEWAMKLDGDVVRIGVSDHAQSELGDIVYVDLPEIGNNVEKNEEAVELESVKAVAHVIAPVSGEIVNVNEALEDDPALINNDPEGEGWIFEIKMSNPSEFDELMDEDTYKNSL